MCNDEIEEVRLLALDALCTLCARDRGSRALSQQELETTVAARQAMLQERLNQRTSKLAFGNLARPARKVRQPSNVPVASHGLLHKQHRGCPVHLHAFLRNGTKTGTVDRELDMHVPGS